MSAIATAALSIGGPAAHASVKIFSFSAIPSTTRAGAHPDFVVEFSLSTHDSDIDPCDCKDAKDVEVHLPTGLIGNPHATPRCDIAQFASGRCPVDSQVGVGSVELANSENSKPGHASQFFTPIFNLIPPPTQPGLLAFMSVDGTPTFENVSARTDSDYGLDVAATSIEHFAPVVAFKQYTWGIPAAPVHDGLRFGFGQPPNLDITGVFSGGMGGRFCDQDGNLSTEDPSTAYQLCPANGGSIPARPIGAEPSGPGGPVSSNSPETPFLQNPTTCGEASLATSIDVLSYDGGTSHAESTWPPTTDCAQLSFNPSQSIAPTTEAADSPSGAEFRLTVPQFESPAVPSPSELRAANVTLAPGFALAPNVMNGKTTCSDAEARFGSREEAHCPENSKLGTISVDTPVLPGPLGGAAYLGEPQPGNRYRLFLVFDGFGVHVKLAGTISPDPQTGQIHIAFADLPQAPFETFNMHIFGSERGPLATPTHCGSYEVSSHWTPWDAALSEQTSRQFFTVDEGPNGQPCPGPTRPFDPGFQAASAASTAGAHTSFEVNLTRNDGDQNLAGLTVKTPPGFAATLKGVPYCPQSSIDRLAGPLYSGALELGSPICAASQVGTLTAGVGAGSHPLYLPGRVYLAGPYKGAPLSLLAVIPAVSGPYDLGNVAVRAAIHVDPATAQITTVSDPLPQIIGGIPIRTRQILIDIDRPDFALNPTNCDPLTVGATLSGDQGALAGLSSHFQVANCADLPYAPKLSIKLSGGLARRGHPAVRATLRAADGEANTRRVSVALPKGELLDQAHIDTICTRPQFAADKCPAGSKLGTATATTPLLDAPLTGSVYLRSSSHDLPDLAVDLEGQIDVELAGRIDTVKGGSLRTTFETVPDAPVSSFSLSLAGGAKGLLQNTESLCGARRRAVVKMLGQNGAVLNTRVKLQASCGKSGLSHKPATKQGGHSPTRVHKNRRAG